MKSMILILITMLSIQCTGFSDDKAETKKTVIERWQEEKKISDFDWLIKNVVKKGDSLADIEKVFGKAKRTIKVEDNTILIYREINVQKELFYDVSITLDKDMKYLSSRVKGIR